MSDVTVILTTYRRPELLGPQVEAIRNQSARAAWLWLWANAPEPADSRAIAAHGFDRVVWCTPNAFVHARFALALLAPTRFVALFDDDTLPGSRWLENCRTSFSRVPGIYGTAGVRLGGAGYRDRTYHGWLDPRDEDVEVDLVGQAWFLPVAWVHALFIEPAVTGTNGEDIELAARAWRQLGVRSFCPPHPPPSTGASGARSGAKTWAGISWRCRVGPRTWRSATGSYARRLQPVGGRWRCDHQA